MQGTGTLEAVAAPRAERGSRLETILTRKRSWIFAPVFLGALALTLSHRAWALPQALRCAGAALTIASWLGRTWATGYRTWVHKDGEKRYLMSAGPYAFIRHPLYVANGLAGVGALVVLGQLELLAFYSVLYVVVIAAIVRREEGALAARFGQDHSTYLARVPAFLPAPGRSVPRSERSGAFSWGPVMRSLELPKLVVILALTAWFLAR